MSVVIPQDIVQASGYSEDELRREFAVWLFSGERLTLAQAASLAGMTRLDFQHLLASRRISVHYGTEELAQDVATLRELRPR